MNRAAARSGEDGDSTQLRSWAETCSPVCKATAIRDIGAKTHVCHVPWQTGGCRHPRCAGSDWEVLAHRPVSQVRE